MAEFAEKIGKKIYEIRMEKGLSQEAVAYMSNMEQAYYSKIERGTITSSPEKYNKIAFALGVPLTFLMEEVDWSTPREPANRLLAGYNEWFNRLSFLDQQHFIEMLDKMFGWRDQFPATEDFESGRYIETYMAEQNIWEVVEETIVFDEDTGYYAIYQSAACDKIEENGPPTLYQTYGIACNRLERGRWVRVDYIPDICLDRKELQRFVVLMQVSNVFLLHFHDLVEDFMENGCCWEY